MVDLITGARSTDRRYPELSVLIDLGTLLHDLHPPVGVRDRRRPPPTARDDPADGL